MNQYIDYFLNLYRFLVKKLHPDINANQTEKEILLWNRTQTAYKIGDLEELSTIKLLLEDIKKVDNRDDSIPVINKQIKTVKEKIFELMQYIKKLKSEFPFTIENNINNENWIKEKNSEIFKKIENIKLQIKELESIIENILLYNIDSPNPETIN
jgi:archaellum component FlaC